MAEILSTSVRNRPIGWQPRIAPASARARALGEESRSLLRGDLLALPCKIHCSGLHVICTRVAVQITRADCMQMTRAQACAQACAVACAHAARCELA
eukprot:2659814-Pleurochrysis_carterae.AAC.2